MKKQSKLGTAIIAGLREALDYERGKISLRSTQIELPPPAPLFSKKDIKTLREKVLHVSQPIFARIMNVSPATVKAWEQGAKRPSGSASRLLELIQVKPNLMTNFLEI